MNENYDLTVQNPFENEAETEPNQNTQIARREMDFAGEIVGARVRAYSSLRADTMEGKKQIYNITNNPDHALKDHIGETILLKDVYVESVVCKNEDGTESVCPRSILIDTAGVSYGCVSMGIFSALKRIISIYGEPTYEEGIAVKVKLINRKANRSVLSLAIV